MWYGLTRDEAELRCNNLGLHASFTETRDPKAVRVVRPETVPPDNPGDSVQPDLSGVPRVIRANEKAGVMMFLLGYFAEESRGLCD